MSIRDPESIRDKNNAKQLIAAGLSWGEPIPWAEKMATAGMALGGFGVFMFAITAIGRWNGAVPMMLLCLLIIVACLAYLRRGVSKPRALIFRHDGTMDVPHGLPLLPHYRKIGGGHGSIMTIDARLKRNPGHPNDEFYDVRLIDKAGGTIIVSRNLSEDDAMRVSVGLSNALRDIRAEDVMAELAAMLDAGVPHARMVD